VSTKLEQTQAEEQRLTLIATLTPLVEQRQALKQVLDELQLQVDELTAQIGEEMVREGLLKLEVDGHSLSYNPTIPRTTVSKEKLVELGVGTDVIKQAEKTTYFPRLDVREKKNG
jgi:hypothetical protein